MYSYQLGPECIRVKWRSSISLSVRARSQINALVPRVDGDRKRRDTIRESIFWRLEMRNKRKESSDTHGTMRGLKIILYALSS